MFGRESVALWAQRVRWRLRRVPASLRVGVGIALVALGGLFWMHYSATDAQRSNETQVSQSQPGPEHHHHEEESQPTNLPDWTPEAGRVVVERFAVNFANPDGGHEQWLARLRPDIAPELADQYQLTDIRNVIAATVTSVEGPIGDTPGTAIFHAVYSDGTRIQIELSMAAYGWTVSTVVPVTDPASAPVPAPAPGGGQ